MELPTDFHTPVAAVLRGGLVESLHLGCIAIADTTGPIFAAGDSTLPIFWRSTAKLHQALAFVAAGGANEFSLSQEELAIICASHNGEPRQVELVRSIFRKLSASPDLLRCGAQEPFNLKAAHELFCRGEKPSPLHNCCSGNHSGLIGLSKVLGAELPSYDRPEHPAQRAALKVVARFAGLEPEEIALGTDGCGIPTYSTSLERLALAYARLLHLPKSWPAEWATSATLIAKAIGAHPTLISGAGDFDAEFNRIFGGSAVCKTGAEALCAASFYPSAQWPNGLGLAIKIADGLGTRGRNVAFVACLEQLEIGTAEQRAALREAVAHDVTTRTGEVVGEIVPVFTLEKLIHRS